MNPLPASFRLSLVLALLTVSIVILGDYIGVLPDPDRTALDTRAKLVESLAVQFSLMAQREDYEGIEQSMEALVDRNDDVYFAVLQTPEGVTLAQAGFSTRPLASTAEDAPVSTATDVRVPIFRGDAVWATVEIEFRRLNEGGLLAIITHPLLRLVTFFAIVGFLTYLLFLRRALRDLDPASVIPDRVKTAMDALAEGVLFLDRRERIVLANAAFGEKVGKTPEALLGTEVSALPWGHARGDEEEEGPARRPWTSVLRDGQSRMGVSLNVTAPAGEVLTFGVNCAPITDPRGTVRGALVTLDDLTELQRKHNDLEDTLEMLQASQEQIKDQNRRLEFLATRDPLTLCLNRRAFIERFTAAFEKAVAGGTELSCIMVDIDHFKSVNDRYGHATGDKVISLMGQSLTGAVRGDDLVCRYGGEEFCVILPETEAPQAKVICERIRQSLPERAWEKEILPETRKLTASFGLATLSLGAATPEGLLDQADKALYAAKDRGRDQVINWGDPEARRAPSEEPVAVLDAHESMTVPEAAAPEPSEVSASELAAAVEAGHSRDAVTGLPDRAAFKQRISQAVQGARAEGQLAMVLLLELRMFRRLGDALGNTAADQVLCEVGRRLDKTVRSTDGLARVDGSELAFVARCGVDKFGIVLSRVESVENATGVAKRLLDTLGERIDIEGQRVNATCNIGISVYPSDGDGPDSLLDRAQIALQYAKRYGAMGYRLYQGYMNTMTALELGLEQELRSALTCEQLRLSYQPVAELQEGRIVALEGLLRWEHPELGLLQPGQFIDVAERSGLMESIGHWALKEACTQVMLWSETGIRDIRIGVNVASAQLCKAGFQDEVQVLLEETRLAPKALELELNEATLAKDLSGGAHTGVEKLRALGVRIVIDDVGARDVNLDYLEHFRPDGIKVDRSLVKGLGRGAGSAERLRTIVELAQRLGITVTAVGVETDAQLDALQGLGCDRVQGYLLCPPLAPARARELLDRDRRLVAAPPVEGGEGATFAEAG